MIASTRSCVAPKSNSFGAARIDFTLDVMRTRQIDGMYLPGFAGMVSRRTWFGENSPPHLRRSMTSFDGIKFPPPRSACAAATPGRFLSRSWYRILDFFTYAILSSQCQFSLGKGITPSSTLFSSY